MFDKFGELDSYTEINELAENLFNEGDIDSLRAMAKENGIEEEIVEIYLSMEIPELCDPMTAALGKIEIESADLKLEGIFVDWTERLKAMCMEDRDIAMAVRRKQKSLEGCMGVLLKFAFNCKRQVNERICKAAGLRDGKRKEPVYMGIPSKKEAAKTIKEYYMK